MTSERAHPYRAEADTLGLWHLDMATFDVPDAEFASDADTSLLYHLEDAGTPVADASANGNIGTVVGTPTMQATGKFALGIDFDGSSYVSAPDRASLDLGSGDFTIEAWVKPAIVDPGAEAGVEQYDSDKN